MGSIVDTATLTPSIYPFLDPNLQSNRELALIALQTHPEFFCYVSPSLRQDPNFVQEAVRKNPCVQNYLQGSSPDKIKEAAFLESLFKIPPQTALPPIFTGDSLFTERTQ